MDQHRLEKCNKLREMGLNPYVVKKMMFFLKMKNLVQQEEFLLKESLEKQLF